MKKQIQKSGDKTENYQAGHNQYIATDGSLINIPKNSNAADLLISIYEDLAKPGVQQVGKAIGTSLGLANIALYPVKYLDTYCTLILKENLEKLRQKLKGENIEKISTVPPEIGKPLLDKLFYVSNNDLSDLFINLLSRASKKDEAYLAHPSFANILSSLSPDEAKILNYLAPREFIRCISLRWEKSEEDYGGVSTVTYFYTKRALIGIEKRIDISFPENYYMYFINMSRLGLVEFQEDSMIDEYMTPAEEYNDIIKHYGNSIHEGEIDNNGYTSRIMLGRVDLSELGIMFVKACTDTKGTASQNYMKKGTSIDPDNIPRENFGGITRKAS